MLLVWGRNASALGGGRLPDNYRSSAPMSKDVVPAASPSRTPVVDARTNRRATDPVRHANPEREQPGPPAERFAVVRSSPISESGDVSVISRQVAADLRQLVSVTH